MSAGADELVQLAQNEPAQGEAGGDEGAQTSTGVEEIVVKGAESAAATDFNVADSVTAFSAADLVALGAANIADLSAFTPNLEIVTAGATSATFFIRGVGLNDFGANATSSAPVYQDDVPMNSQALQLGTLFDMETVNILRGPQGTGLARNASAGAIKLYGRKPTGQYTGFLRGRGGNFSYQEYEGAVEAPIFEDMLSGRLAFIFTDRDGTMKNRCGGAPPFSQRVPVPLPGVLNANRQTETGGPWSICGENPYNGTLSANPGGAISDVPVGLPKWVNDKHNWAARSTFLFEPTLDTSFLVNAHLTRRNELSRLGQSMGTNGYTCLNGDVANCSPVAPNTSRVVQVLGGTQGNGGAGYQSREIKQALTNYAPCYQWGWGYQNPAGCGAASSNPNFAVFDLAKRKVARKLARNLDKEPWQGDFNQVGPTKNDTEGVSLKSEITLPYDLEIDAVSGFDRYHRHVGVDLDFSPETLFQIDTHDSGYQFYQDVKLGGETPIFDTPITWDIGGWVLPEKIDVNVLVDLGKLSAFGVGERNYTQRLLSMGGYGSFSFDFSEDFTLDGGVRFNYEEKKMNYLLTQNFGGVSLELPLTEHDYYHAPTGTIRLTYRFSEDTHVFWKYTRGFKPGHYNATGSYISGITKAEPEYIDAYETGLRSEWFGGMLSTEASLFYYNYKGYQIFTAQQFAGSGPEFIVINANDAEVYGAEVNATVRAPWQGGYVNVNFGWLESQFLDFVLLQQAIVNLRGGQQTINRELQNSGHPLLNSPRFKVAITAEQALPLGKYGYLIPRYDGSWTDDTYYDATKGRGIPNLQGKIYAPKSTFAQRAHWIHNARLAYRTPDGRLEIAGWGRNLENSAYKTYTFDGSTFQQTSIYFVGDPRTFGGDITVTF